MDVVYNLNDQQIEQLYEMYQQEWWSRGRSLEETRLCVSGSQLCIGVVEAETLIGFARVITDYTFKALIFDVIIRKDCRSKGLGGRLINLIKNHSRLSRVKHFELYCLPEMTDFYLQHGFEVPHDIQLMRNTAHS